MSPQERSEQCRQAARARWQCDTEGIDRYIDKLVQRAPAITPEQRARLEILLTNPRTEK